MKSLLEIQDDIINFWDIDEEKKRAEILAEIVKYSTETEPEKFIAEVRSNFKQHQDSGIGVIYDALSDRGDKWGDFFKEEYKRAFREAEQSNDAFAILECLEEISMVEEDQVESRAEIISFLATYIAHKNDVLRYKSIWILGDWISEENQSKYPDLIEQIKEKLKDKNWKIRYAAKEFLEGLNKLPKAYQLGFMDKMRLKIFNPYEM